MDPFLTDAVLSTSTGLGTYVIVEIASPFRLPSRTRARIRTANAELLDVSWRNLVTVGQICPGHLASWRHAIAQRHTVSPHDLSTHAEVRDRLLLRLAVSGSLNSRRASELLEVVRRIERRQSSTSRVEDRVLQARDRQLTSLLCSIIAACICGAGLLVLDMTGADFDPRHLGLVVLCVTLVGSIWRLSTLQRMPDRRQDRRPAAECTTDHQGESEEVIDLAHMESQAHGSGVI